MFRWKPDFCSGGQCSILYRQDHAADHVERVEQTCQAHRGIPVASLHDALLGESQAKERGRADVAERLGISTEAVSVSFDDQRRIRLRVPDTHRASVTPDLQRAIADAHPNVTVET